MKTILTKKGDRILVDDESYDMLSTYSWCVLSPGRRMGRKQKYAATTCRDNGKKKLNTMHRMIMKAVKGQMIDHINGDGLDNRKENLRFCTKSQNAANAMLSLGNKSGVKGVYWDKQRKKWHAQIVVRRKTIALGRYTSLIEATEYRDKMAKKLHGEHARTNKDLAININLLDAVHVKCVGDGR